MPVKKRVKMELMLTKIPMQSAQYVDVNKDTDAECIVRCIKRNDSLIKSFYLDSEQYSAINYLPYQLTEIKRFCVENTGILSVDTTFEICDGLFLTDKNYPNLSLLDKRTTNHRQFPVPSFSHFKKMRRHTEDLLGKWPQQSHQLQLLKRSDMILINPLSKVREIFSLTRCFRIPFF